MSLFYRQLELGEAIAGARPKVKHPIEMLTDLYRMSGVSGLFTGIVPRLARVAPACAVMITTYEGFKAYFVRRLREANKDCVDTSKSGDNSTEWSIDESSSSFNVPTQIGVDLLTSSGLTLDNEESRAIL